MTIADHMTAVPVHDTPKRRGVLGALATGGMTLVGALAGVTTSAQEAQAKVRGPLCCNLYTSVQCAYANCRFWCPPGYSPKAWSCLAGTRPIYCGECTKGKTCWDLPIACSVWWDDNAC